jgi:hypothetical protein
MPVSAPGGKGPGCCQLVLSASCARPLGRAVDPPKSLDSFALRRRVGLHIDPRGGTFSRWIRAQSWHRPWRSRPSKNGTSLKAPWATFWKPLLPCRRPLPRHR